MGMKTRKCKRTDQQNVKWRRRRGERDDSLALTDRQTSWLTRRQTQREQEGRLSLKDGTKCWAAYECRCTSQPTSERKPGKRVDVYLAGT